MIVLLPVPFYFIFAFILLNDYLIMEFFPIPFPYDDLSSNFMNSEYPIHGHLL